MIYLITGATHVGKTILAQRIMEKNNIPYMSQDHIKMGLIRSGYCMLPADSPDETMTAYLWPVTKEIIMTAIENDQNLIIEGCYIPFTWRKEFEENYLQYIKFICLCFSEKYINEQYSDIIKYENVIEKRLDDGYCTKELLKKENSRFNKGCRDNGLFCVTINEDYEKSIDSMIFDIG